MCLSKSSAAGVISSKVTFTVSEVQNDSVLLDQADANIEISRSTSMHCEWDERRSRDNLSNDLSNQQEDERVDPQVQKGVVTLIFDRCLCRYLISVCHI